MPSRRPDGEPSLLDRIRWGRLARLAAVVAAGLLVALGPRACGSGATRPALPPDAPAVAGPGDAGTGGPPPERVAKPSHHGGKRRHRIKRRQGKARREAARREAER